MPTRKTFFLSFYPPLHTNVNLKVTQKILPSFQSLRIKKIDAWNSTSHFSSLSSQVAAPKENNLEKSKTWGFFKIKISLSEVTQVGIIPPYWQLHLLRSWGVSKPVRVLQGLKGETGMAFYRGVSTVTDRVSKEYGRGSIRQKIMKTLW